MKVCFINICDLDTSMDMSDNSGLILENTACVLYNEKVQQCSVKGYSYNFLPLSFPNLGHLECFTPLNGM